MASFTKLWTSRAIMKLYEEGKLDLDAPAYTYLEQAYAKDSGGKALDTVFGPNIRTVTTRELLSMRGGIADYDELEYQAQHPLEDIGPGESAAFFGSSQKGVSPGTC